MAKRFGVAVGLSDHTTGIIAPVVAVAHGARMIEKHFIMDRSIGGPDASFSLDEAGFAAMVTAVRDAEKAIGRICYEVSDKMQQSRGFSRSLFVVEDIAQGEKLTARNIRSIRPGYGLHPKYYDSVMGKTARRKLERGTPLSLEDLNQGASCT
jgi:pseudaminic acid synthase